MKREDLQGKQILSSNEKYYIADHGIREAIFGGNMRDINLILENIVYLELLRRGFDVTVGRNGNKEIDFVASRRNEKIYIQVSDNISDEQTLQREVKPLLEIKDAYPKIIIARTRHDNYQYEGIQIFDIANWLAE